MFGPPLPPNPPWVAKEEERFSQNGEHERHSTCTICREDRIAISNTHFFRGTKLIPSNFALLLTQTTPCDDKYPLPTLLISLPFFHFLFLISDPFVSVRLTFNSYFMSSYIYIKWFYEIPYINNSWNS